MELRTLRYFLAVAQEFGVDFCFEKFLFKPALGHFFFPLLDTAALAAVIEVAVEIPENVPPWRTRKVCCHYGSLFCEKTLILV